VGVEPRGLLRPCCWGVAGLLMVHSARVPAGVP